MKRRIHLPEDPAQRTLVMAVAVSVLLHLLLLGALFVFPDWFTTPSYVKRGEPLLVDIAPERPEEKAPLGNPSRPVGPDLRERPRPTPAPPRTVLPPAPKPVPPPPRPAAPAPDPPAPESPKAVAKAEPPAPEGLGKIPEPEPAAPRAPDSARSEAEPPPAARPAPPSQPRVAIARPPSIWRQPGGGGGLQGGGRGGVEGEPIPLDTPEPKYQDYFNKIREKIRANWTYPREAGERGIEGELLIEFHIGKDGRLSYIELRRSSGTSILDAYAMNAVRFADPFPPVPDDISKEAVAINGMFRYQIVSGFVNQFLR